MKMTGPVFTKPPAVIGRCSLSNSALWGPALAIPSCELCIPGLGAGCGAACAPDGCGASRINNAKAVASLYIRSKVGSSHAGRQIGEVVVVYLSYLLPSEA